MTACATSPIPHPRVPPAAGPAGGGGCCTGGGPPHGRVPAALPPPASGSRAGRPRRRGPAPQLSPSRPRTPSRPRRRGGGSGPNPPGSPEVEKVDAMPDGDLRHLAEVEEISIGFTRSDGSAGSAPVWVVQAGDAIFVRSIRGRRGGWYRRLGANPDGEVGDRVHTHPVRARPIENAGTIEAVTRADAAKYSDSPYVKPLLTEKTADATTKTPAVTTVATNRRSPNPGPHQAGQGRPDPGRRPPLHRPHPQLQPQPGRAGSGVVRRRRQCSATGPHAGVRARNLATDSPPKRRFIAWSGSRRSGQGSTL